MKSHLEILRIIQADLKSSTPKFEYPSKQERKVVLKGAVSSIVLDAGVKMSSLNAMLRGLTDFELLL